MLRKGAAGNAMKNCNPWNRMVAVLDSQGGLMETMSYTASGMRGSAVDVNLCAGNTVSHSYYSADWQVVQRTDTMPDGCCGYTTSTSTYVWGLTYVNDLVARDQDGEPLRGTSHLMEPLRGTSHLMNVRPAPPSPLAHPPAIQPPPRPPQLRNPPRTAQSPPPPQPPPSRPFVQIRGKT